MKKITLIKLTLVALFVMGTGRGVAQFNLRERIELKGDMFTVGNNITGISNSALTTNIDIAGQNMQYINVDPATGIFSSSSANLSNFLPTSCYRIKYAALYWAGMLDGNSLSATQKADIAKVKIKLPSGASYLDVTNGIVIRDGRTSINGASPYVCYADVTALLAPIETSGAGVFTVANVRSSTGVNTTIAPDYEGFSAGWSLYIVYEDNSRSTKTFVSYDGLAAVGPTTGEISTTISDFEAFNPTSSVKAQIAFAGLAGSQSKTGDTFKINDFPLSNSLRPQTGAGTLSSPYRYNFYSSSISNDGIQAAGNNPANTNTLGFDTGVESIPNSGNLVIPNNAISAVLKLSSDDDKFYHFFHALSIDSQEAKILVEKRIIELTDGNRDKTGGIVTIPVAPAPDKVFEYVITFKNIGNEDATNIRLIDQLPAGLVFTPGLASIKADASIPPPVISGTNLLTFTIPDALMKVGTPEQTIRIRVSLTSNCETFRAACSNEIKNSATIKYQTFSVSTDKEAVSAVRLTTACNKLFEDKGTTNLTINTSSCTYNSQVVFCGLTTTLTASPGYTSYQWYRGTGSGTIITGQTGPTYNAPAVGDYFVLGTKDPLATRCYNIREAFQLVEFTGGAQKNPVEGLPGVSSTPLVCSITGKETPIIQLCGATASLPITPDPSITGTSSISWELLTPGGCPPQIDPLNCPQTSPSCTAWVVQGTGPTFTATNAGEYRIVLEYTGGCRRIYYFKVFKNTLDPRVVKRDEVCTRKGSIRIDNVAPGYEYAFVPDGQTPTAASYTTSNTSPPLNVGLYDVYIRSTTATTGNCIFEVPNINIVKKESKFEVDVVQPGCRVNNTTPTTGTINASVTDGDPDYKFTLYSGTVNSSNVASATLLQTRAYSSNATATPPFTVNPGTYTVRYESLLTDGCDKYETRTINPGGNITVTLTPLKQQTSCEQAEYRVFAQGSAVTNPQYQFRINNTGLPITITATELAAGGKVIVVPRFTNPSITQSITVFDRVNCSSQPTTITLRNIAPPTFNTPSQLNVQCFGNATGSITFNPVLPLPADTQVRYSINNGVTFQSSPVFNNLSANSYVPIAEYQYLNQGWCRRTPGFTPNPIIITQPLTGLTATAAVRQLVGCGTGANAGKALVRITNPRGGTPPYQYDFGAGFQSLSEAWINPGVDQIIRIQDRANCPFEMRVTILPIPPDPTITLRNLTFGCDGIAAQQVDVTSPSGVGFEYDYFIAEYGNGPVPNPYTGFIRNTNNPENFFPNVQTGENVIRVEFRQSDVPTPSNLLVETFGAGPDTQAPGINTRYCFQDQNNGPAIDCKGNAPALNVDDNEYTVTKRIEYPFGGNNPNAGWDPVGFVKDHTSLGTNPQGRFFLINIGAAASTDPNPITRNVLYNVPIVDVIPNQPITVKYWIHNIMEVGAGGDDPDIGVELVQGFGTPGAVVIAQEPRSVFRTRGLWVERIVILNPGNNTQLNFLVRSYSTIFGGNDLAIDDISVFQEPLQCRTTKDFPVKVQAGTAFAAQVTNTPRVSCNGAADARVTIAAQNFDPAAGFQYRILRGATVLTTGDPQGWVTSLTSPVTPSVLLGAGAITVEVRKDALTTNPPSCFKSIPITVTSPNVTTVTGTGVPGSCTADPRITNITASGGTPPYTFTAVNSTGVSFGPVNQGQDIKVPTLVNSETYTLSVTDSNGCKQTATTIITIPGVPVLNLDYDRFASDLCFDQSTPPTRLVLLATGGTRFPAATHPLGYEYTLDLSTNTWQFNSLTSNVFSNLVPGVLYDKIAVRDALGCVKILPPLRIGAELIVTGNLVKDLTCSIPSAATYQITISGGTAPYRYQIGTTTPLINVPTASTITVNPVATTVYTVYDANNCSKVVTATLTPATNPSATESTTQETCGNKNGTATVVPSGGSGIYTSVLLNSITLTQPPYTFTGLAAGSYPYRVTDSKGCFVDGTAVVTSPNAITGTLRLNRDLECGTANAPVSGELEFVGVSGGTAPYTYSIGSLPPQSSTIFNTNILAGNYTGTIIDAAGCTFQTNQITINALPIPTLTVASKTKTGCFTAPALPNGSVTLIASTGPAGITYQYQIVSPPAYSTAPGPGLVFSNLDAGTYVFQVTNSKGCTARVTEFVEKEIEISVVKNTENPVKCRGESNGTATLTVSNYVTSFTYQVGSQPVSAPQTNPTIPLSGLAEGSYSILVTDTTTGCTSTATVNITQPATALTLGTPNTTPVNCFNPNTGTVTLSASGGAPGYRYIVTTPGGVVLPQQVNNPLFSGLAIGIHSYSVIDANGCQLDSTFNIIDAPRPIATFGPEDLCYINPTSPSITIVGSGGVSPYTYSRDGINYIANGGVFNNLTPQNYSFTVRDANGCVSNPITKTVHPRLQLTASKRSDIQCDLTGATILLNIIGGNPATPFTSYTLEESTNGGLSYSPLTGLVTGLTFSITKGAGTFIYRITDTTTGCIATSLPVTVDPYVPLGVPTMSKVDAKCNGTATGSFTVTNLTQAGINGVPNYTFEVKNSLGVVIRTGNSTSNVVNNLLADTYTVEVTDGKGCKSPSLPPVTVTIGQFDPIAFELNEDDEVCNLNNPNDPGKIKVSAVSGGGPLLPAVTTNYRYTLTSTLPGFVTQYFPSATTYTNVTSHDFDGYFGLYTVRIEDENGCFVDKSINVGAPPIGVDIDLASYIIDCTSTPPSVDVTISATAVPGSGPFEFSYVGLFPVFIAPDLGLDPSGLTAVFDNLIPGTTYTFIVRNTDTQCEYREDLFIPGSVIDLTAIPLPSKKLCTPGVDDGTVSFAVGNIAPSSTQINFEVRDFANPTNVVIASPGPIPVNLPVGTIGTLLPTGSYIITATGINILNFGGSLASGSYFVLVSENGGGSPGCVTNTGEIIIGLPPVNPLSVDATIKNVNCKSTPTAAPEGQITAIAVNGQSPYLYQVVPTTTIPNDASWLSASTSDVFNRVAATYDIYIRDANGCISFTTKTVATDPSPDLNPLLVTPSTLCNTDDGFYTIDVSLQTVGIAPFKYTVTKTNNPAPGPYQIINTAVANFTTVALVAGNYNVTVEDANGCTSEENITIYPPLKSTPNVTYLNTTCNANGVITLTTTGGSGTVKNYAVIAGPQTPAPNNSGIFTGLIGGNYTIQITDNLASGGTGCFITVDVSVKEDIIPVIDLVDLSIKSPSCNPGQGIVNDGTVQVIPNATFVDIPFTFDLALQSAPTVVVQTSLTGSFTGLSAGIPYRITATSISKCSDFVDFTIPANPAIAIDPLLTTVTPFTCNAANQVGLATLTISASGGVGTLSYSINGSSLSYQPGNTFQIPDTTPTPITVFVRDQNGCVTFLIVPFTKLNPISAAFNRVTPINCSNDAETVLVLPSGGSGTTFTITPEPASPNVTAGANPNEFLISQPGDYFFKVTDNTSGCYIITDKYTVAPFNLIEVTAVQKADVKCYNGTTGEAEINITGYTGPITYTVRKQDAAGNFVDEPGFIGIAGTTPTVTISNLPAGIFQIVVLEGAAPFCDKTSNSFTIEGPTELLVSLNVLKNTNCLPAGILQAAATGGKGPYQYIILPSVDPAPLENDARWTSTDKIENLTNLIGYTAYAKDANDCIASSSSEFVGLDPVPAIDAAPVAVCGVSEGAFEIKVDITTAGIPPYSYTYTKDSGTPSAPINVGNVATFTLPSLSSGIYDVTVTDANGCFDTVSGITIFPPLFAGNDINLQPSCTADGEIELTIIGGSGNFEYTVNGGTAIAAPARTVTITEPAGSYAIVVRDLTTTCTSSTNAELLTPTPVTGIALNPTSPTCFGAKDGKIVVSIPPSNDNPIYTYEIISAPPTYVAPAGINNQSNEFTDLPQGSYTIRVTSGRGCSDTATETVTEPNQVTIPILTPTQFACTAGENTPKSAKIVVTGVTGGSGNYVNYKFEQAGVVLKTGADNSYETFDLAGGTIDITVTDDKGCPGTTQVTINPFYGIENADFEVIDPITCTTTESVRIKYTTVPATLPVGVTLNLEFKVEGTDNTFTATQQNNPDFTGLGIGQYLATVTNLDTGCSTFKNFSVIDPNTFVVEAIPTKAVCFDDLGSVTINVKDQLTSPKFTMSLFDYEIRNVSNNTVASTGSNTVIGSPTAAINLPAGKYTVTATLRGSPNCTTLPIDFDIEGPPSLLEATITSKKITCNPGNDGEISLVEAKGGVVITTYKYQLVKDGVRQGTYGDQTVFPAQGPGTYELYIMDDNGCEKLSNTEVLVNPSPIFATLSPATQEVNCFNDQTATITVSTPTGGNDSGYIYSLIKDGVNLGGSQPTGIFTNLPKGEYEVAITDPLNCTFTTNKVLVNEPDLIVGNLSASAEKCAPNQAILTLKVTGGRPPYTYTSSTGTVLTPSSSTLVGAETTAVFPIGTRVIGNNVITITDSNSCTPVQSNPVEIRPYAPIQVTFDPIPEIFCFGGTTTIRVVARDGVNSDYLYTLIPSAGTTPNNTGVFENIPALASGVYDVEVSSAGECPVRKEVPEFREPGQIILSRQITNVKCNGASTGVVKIIVEQNPDNEKIQFSMIKNGQPTPTIDTQIGADGKAFVEFTSLPKDTYPVIIRQGTNGCDNIYEFDTTLNALRLLDATGEPYEVLENPRIELDGTPVISQEACSGDGADIQFTIKGGIKGVDNTVPEPGDLSGFQGYQATVPGIATPFYSDATGVFSLQDIPVPTDGNDLIIEIRDSKNCDYPLPVKLRPGVEVQESAITDNTCPDVDGNFDYFISVFVNPEIPAGEFTYTLKDSNGVDLFTNQISPDFIGPSIVPGVYSVIVTHTDPVDPTIVCEKTISDVEVVLYTPLSILTYDYTPNKLNFITALAEGGSGDYTYEILLEGRSLGTVDADFEIFKSGNYTVIVTDSKGCSIQETKYFVYIDIEIPNFFTPDGTGTNNTWTPMKIDNFPDIETDIFDRYGRLLTTLKQKDTWDGKYKNNDLPSGDYWYVIKLNRKRDRREFTGHFTLYR
jgi:large repetitive protein